MQFILSSMAGYSFHSQFFVPSYLHNAIVKAVKRLAPSQPHLRFLYAILWIILIEFKDTACTLCQWEEKIHKTMYVPLSYPDQCQRYAGTLTSVRGMQVPWPVSEVCKYPDQCQRYAGTLTSVRGMQVPWPVSGVCKYPDQCQGYASTLTSVRGMQVPWPVSRVLNLSFPNVRH